MVSAACDTVPFILWPAAQQTVQLFNMAEACRHDDDSQHGKSNPASLAASADQPLTHAHSHRSHQSSERPLRRRAAHQLEDPQPEQHASADGQHTQRQQQLPSTQQQQQQQQQQQAQRQHAQRLQNALRRPGSAPRSRHERVPSAANMHANIMFDTAASEGEGVRLTTFVV